MNTACWNWALAGIVDHATMVRPQTLCDWATQDTLDEQMQRDDKTSERKEFISQRFEYDISAARGANAAEVAWFGHAQNRTDLTAIRHAWRRSNRDDDAIEASSKALARLAIKANGLQLSGNASVYKIGISYHNPMRMPGFDHWWVQVEGVFIEIHPRLQDIQLWRQGQDMSNSTHFTVDVAGLHQRHIDRIMQTIYPTQWQADNSVTRCTNCRTEFGMLTRRHHCRACGRIFCDACTPGRRIVSRAAVRPGSAPEAGLVRVCVNCR
jgi:hypothetical protein